MNLSRGHIEETLDEEANLKAVMPIIQALYMEDNVPAWLVSNILEEFFDFKISQGCLRKRFVKKAASDSCVKKRTRTKDLEGRRIQVILGILKSINSARFSPLLRSHPRLKRHLLQEKALYSISQILDSMFVPDGNQTWKANPIGFVCPDGTDLSPEKWRAVEAYCDSMSTMLRCNQIRAAQLLLSELDNGLEGFVDQVDPLFLGKIWKLAMLLHGLDRRAPHLQALSIVLGRLRDNAYTKYGPKNPVADILDCILDVAEADFRITIRIGFQATLKSLDDKISDDNIMTLNLWSTYAQYFCKPYVKPVKRKPLSSSPAPQPKTLTKTARKSASETPPYERLEDSIRSDILFLKFNQVWHECHNPERMSPELWRQSEACLRISHYYAYSAFWVCGKTIIAQKMAQDIIQDARPILASQAVWTSRAMAFTVASRISAGIHRKQIDFDNCETTLMQAIDLLRTGDNTCRMRAIGLCLTLSSWKQLQAQSEVRRLFSKQVELSSVSIDQAQKVSHMQGRWSKTTKHH
ncbi:subunit P of phosphatidylinositol n-acetylglucosaminyltransferase [Fusarium pseudocircinatum]|uniref:Subunit P of phosphatidylinositol n-acetylglucosaminyltransferase n=1 Tax=Fusarium pseudocircinatum TaxID=56676 RepID=A0A8H5P1G8_9HYPO|nr:subunit P of phosphatidylinositol n-acetylglucosaminyltransferase [Fusarium pseudocircinatum]